MMSIPAVELRGINKAFPGVKANADLHLQVEKGSIHAIVGENGAGKSTAMKILYGVYHPDSGEILVHGEPRRWGSPKAAIAAGLGMVHQHFMLAGPYSALDNVLLGAEMGSARGRWLPGPLRLIDRGKAERELRSLAGAHGFEVPWEAPVESLPVGVQQRIEILKALYRKAEILILDEPTAVLTPPETVDLFANLKSLADGGKTILIITHKLNEVMAISDRVTVMKAGRVVRTISTRETSARELGELMVGRPVDIMPASARVSPAPGTCVLEIRNLRMQTGPRDDLAGVSLSVRAGEIVGIAGVDGNGQTELIQAIMRPGDFGKKLQGSIRYGGEEGLRWKAREVREYGIGLIPEDRHREGLLLRQSVLANFLLGLERLPRFSRRGFVARQGLREAASRAVEAYDVRPRTASLLDMPIRGLSGGNQQKLIIARELERSPKLLIAAQPTRGVDIGAIEFIHGRLRQAKADGMGILLVSSELEEIFTLSDRILVFYEGRIVAEFDAGKVDHDRLGYLMGGGRAS